MQLTSVRAALALVGDGSEKKLLDDTDIRHYIRARLTRVLGSLPPDMDHTFLCTYSPAHGFMIAVDDAVNLPKAKVAFAVTSVSPPGSLYWGSVADSTCRPFSKCGMVSRQKNLHSANIIIRDFRAGSIGTKKHALSGHPCGRITLNITCSSRSTRTWWFSLTFGRSKKGKWCRFAGP
jgi:hypothetical protein